MIPSHIQKHLPRLLIPAVGLLWASAFPNQNATLAAWMIPGSLLWISGLKHGEHAFKTGFFIGFFHFLISLSWLLKMPFPAGAVAGWLALSAYLALFPALWCRAMHLDCDGLDSPGKAWIHRQVRVLSGAALWVGLEMIQARLMTGFPWNLLGASQHPFTPFIQIASITGVYGISFMVVWISTAIWMTIRHWATQFRLKKLQPWFFLPELVMPLLVFAVIWGWGAHRLSQKPALSRELKVAIVQPSIPQDLIWDPDADALRFQKLIALTGDALQKKPDLLIWPEAALPNMLRYDSDQTAQILDLLAETPAWMILGSDDAEPREDAKGEVKYDFYNSAFLIDPEGRLRSFYRKRRLVLFGEYVPLSEYLPFLKRLTPIQGSFKPGDSAVDFFLDDMKVNLSCLICFEDVFPHLAGEHVQSGTHLLVNLTNDGWFGESAAHGQHAVNALFRAVENGIPLVRAANNGISCWIDAFGRMHGIEFEDGRSIHAEGIKLFHIPIRLDGIPFEPTFYRKHGDWFGWGCLVLATLWMSSRCFMTRKREASGR